MSIVPNRQGLKELAEFNIDAQFCQQYGTQLFNYQGEVTEQYQAMCNNLLAVLDDIMTDCEAIRRQIATGGRE